jgi:hypothetical protein
MRKTVHLTIRVVVWCAAMSLVSRVGVAAGVHPYQAIAARNVFHLVQPVPGPEPSPEEAAPVAPLPAIVTGVIDLNGRAQALLEVAGTTMRAVLEKGGSLGDLRIVDIDVRQACVRVSFRGGESLLSLGARPAAGAKLTLKNRR